MKLRHHRGIPTMSHALWDGQPQSDTNVAAPVDDPQIELVGVRKTFGDVVAVEGADLTVGDGELFASSARRVR